MEVNNNINDNTQDMTGTIEAAILVKGVKYIGICLFVWFIQPILNFFVIQVDTIALLSPYWKAVMVDLTTILAVVVPLLLGIKYVYEIYKIKQGKNKK